MIGWNDFWIPDPSPFSYITYSLGIQYSEIISYNFISEEKKIINRENIQFFTDFKNLMILDELNEITLLLLHLEF